jgi:hypothetical protein
VNNIYWGEIAKIELKFPTAVQRNMTFRLYQQSSLGQYAVSPPITILVTSERYSNITYENWLRARIDDIPEDENLTDLDINVTITKFPELAPEKIIKQEEEPIIVEEVTIQDEDLGFGTNMEVFTADEQPG